MHQSTPSMGEMRFDLLAEIAVGSTATIELCRVVEGPLTDELVAVKRLHPHIAEDPQFVDMFRDEIWMASALKHPNIARVVGWGEDEMGSYLAVEFVRGVSLQRLMKTAFDTGELFGERMVVHIASSICAGLAEAHALKAASGEALGLVHRDLTPGNVLLGFAGEVRITDFGLAKAKQRLTKTLTGLLKGKPRYMAPEQVLDRAIDGRTDLFALGVVMFELFTGRRPWKAATDLDAMRAITDRPPADMSVLRPKIDRALAELVHRALKKEPGDRFQSALELHERLEHWLRVHGYTDGNRKALARFVRRNAMRQMRWFDRAVAGEFSARAQEEREVRMAEAGKSVPVPASVRGIGGAPSSQRAPQEVDWGEDGPTLIKPQQEARRMAKPVPLARRRTPSAEETTQRELSPMNGGGASGRNPLAGKGQVATVTIIDPSETETLTNVARPIGRLSDSEQETTEFDEATRRQIVRGDASGGDGLGVVVGPEPDVPPPPVQGKEPYRGASASAEARETRSANYVSEAREMSRLASRAAARADRAAAMAEAAARAAELAAQAASLAERGAHEEAGLRLKEAQLVRDAAAEGRLPRRRRAVAEEPMADAPRWYQSVREEQWVSFIVAAAVIFVVLMGIIVAVFVE